MSKGQHIASAFDRDIEGIQALIMKMGGLVEESIHKAGNALHDVDLDLADAVIRTDETIDALQMQINDEVARVIALRAPTAIDLRIILSVFRIAASLERIGDYSKNIGKRTRVLAGMAPVNDAAASLQRMAREVRLMLKDALDAYIRRDDRLAAEVRLRDENIDQMYNSLFREFITFMLEDQRTITACMHLHFMAKNIERMGDHATTIAEQVIYMVTGDLPGDARPKADHTTRSSEADLT